MTPRVYLCDDERDYRVLLKAVLNAAEGMEVVGEGGDSGFCLADAVKHQPDVLLLDINMPGAQGIDALPQLLEALPNTAIIMLTSAGPEQYERRALDAGAAGFIQKPRSIFDLPGMIRQKLADAGIDL